MTWLPWLQTRRADNLTGPLSASLVLHAGLAVFFIGSAIYSHTGENWGGPGGAITVGVVGSLPAVPLPRPDVEIPEPCSGRIERIV